MEAKQTPVYDHSEIEAKWQKKWEDDHLYDSVIDESKPKHYALSMLPYPSGDIHIGHWFNYIPPDARARFMRMRGYNVLFPVGFDAFGLPAENAAIKRNIHPKTWTYANIDKMRVQLRTMGTMFDWKREIVTSDPEYYKWTQWFFLQFFKNNLAYRKFSPVDWCPTCNTTLAREQVWGDDHHCERCGTPVIKKNLNQWFFRITKYAEELLRFDGIDWPERVKTLQTNWIGKSEGARVQFGTESGETIEVFTTRPDTLYGATFMVLAPEHPMVDKLTTEEQRAAVEAYKEQAQHLNEIQRTATDKEKTGVFTGGYAINPLNGARVPVWISDYVLITYGTGAIMAVPGHDDRDFAFALKFGLPILPVIDRTDDLVKAYIPAASWSDALAGFTAEKGWKTEHSENGKVVSLTESQAAEFEEFARNTLDSAQWVMLVGKKWVFLTPSRRIQWKSLEAESEILNAIGTKARSLMELLYREVPLRDALLHVEYGTIINSGPFSGTPGDQAKRTVIDWLQKQGKGEQAITYHLRDWLISRQRYWGAPIPIVYCDKCGVVAVPESQLPVTLPDDVEWRPTGESPLKLHPTWKHTTCPTCGGPAERETDTMDTFMCSSWYHLRYLSPWDDSAPVDQKEYDYWMPLDTYTGGIEHATMHLIYTRFFHKACRDLGITEGNEPMQQLRNQGMILGNDGEKMSKSRGNVIAPDDIVKVHGADTVRAYLMFFSRWELGGPWSAGGIEGTSRWIRRVWSIIMEPAETRPVSDEVIKSLRRKLHQSLKSIQRDFIEFGFNTVVSTLMELLNEMSKAKQAGVYGTEVWKEAVRIYLLMLAPVTPHLAEEIWTQLGYPYSIHQQAWPIVDEESAKDEEITLIIQVNGKVRDRIVVPVGLPEEEAKSRALSSEAVQKFLEGKTPRQVIYVRGKLINIVI